MYHSREMARFAQLAEGICTLLGLEPFTPQNLRRTAATICGRWFSPMRRSHRASTTTTNANDKPLPAVTGKHHNHRQRKNMQDKRCVPYRRAAHGSALSASRHR